MRWPTVWRLAKGTVICTIKCPTMAKIIHQSFPEQYARIKHPGSFKEKALSEYWEESCAPKPCVNFGQGVFGDLMISWKQKITARDARIAASLIQWLGTNCGFCWLEQALNKANQYLINERTRDYLTSCQTSFRMIGFVRNYHIKHAVGNPTPVRGMLHDNYHDRAIEWQNEIQKILHALPEGEEVEIIVRCTKRVSEKVAIQWIRKDTGWGPEREQSLP